MMDKATKWKHPYYKNGGKGQIFEKNKSPGRQD